MLSSDRAKSFGLAMVGALLLAVSFPRASLGWCAPIGAAALFLAWEGASWKRSFATGWFAGLIFFTISYWWWSTTIVTEVGALAYVAVIVAAAIEGTALGVAGALSAIARGRALPAVAPLATAAAYAVTEWLRSVGPVGVPFAQLGYTQADTPLRALAAFVGTNGLTFVLCIFAAYAAQAIATRSYKRFASVTATLVAITIVAWFAWPARTLAPATIPVAAVQGNIAQSLKWEPDMLQRSINTYTSMTLDAFAKQPKLVLWPETVITVAGVGLPERPDLIAQFTQLARHGNATIVVGSIRFVQGRAYNTLFVFTPMGLTGMYDKRNLVPFAEHFPGQAWLWWLPYIGQLNGNFAIGDGPTVFPTTAGVTIGPLICWESAFGDEAFDEVRSGAQVLVIATDDAWFGTSSGPYQHAQIAQLRAIESGDYVLRAAATGISGIIAPDGTWKSVGALETQTIAQGFVGSPQPTVFSRIGPWYIFWSIAVMYLLALLPVRRA